MKITNIVAAGLVAFLGAGTAAQAQDWHHGRHDRDGGGAYAQRSPQWQGRHQQQRVDVHPRYQQRYDGARRYDGGQRYHGGQRYYGAAVPRTYQPGYAPQYAPRHVYSEQHRYARGGYLPREYLAQRYWVNDWRARQFAAPPYGYQWVQADTGDYVLAALATGLIANLIINSY